MNDSERLDELIDLAWDLWEEIEKEDTALIGYPKVQAKAKAVRSFIQVHCCDDDRHVEGGRE